MRNCLVSFAPKIIILVSFVIRKVVKHKMPLEEKWEMHLTIVLEESTNIIG